MLRLRLLPLLLALGLSVAATAHAQTPAPPASTDMPAPPTATGTIEPTPAPTATLTLPEHLWVKGLDAEARERILREWGLGLLVVVVLGGGLALWLAKPYLDGIEERRKEQAKKDVDRLLDGQPEWAEATARYLAAVLDDYRFVKFRGQGARARNIEPPELDRVYVSLHMRPNADAKSRSRLKTVSAISDEEADEEPERLSE